MPVTTGAQISAIRDTLKLTYNGFALALGTTEATLRKHIKSKTPGLTLCLAAECLLRRAAVASNTYVTPEERAERRFREQQRLQELKASTAPPAKQRRTPEEQAAYQVQLGEARREIRAAMKRNEQRRAEQPLILRLHAQLSACHYANNLKEYYRILGDERQLMDDMQRPQRYVAAFLEACDGSFPPIDHPNVTLRMEPIPGAETSPIK